MKRKPGNTKFSITTFSITILTHKIICFNYKIQMTQTVVVRMIGVSLAYTRLLIDPQNKTFSFSQKTSSRPQTLLYSWSVGASGTQLAVRPTCLRRLSDRSKSWWCRLEQGSAIVCRHVLMYCILFRLIHFLQISMRLIYRGVINIIISDVPLPQNT